MINHLIKNLEYFELQDYKHFDIVAGIDEAGRGSIAGPVSVSLITFPLTYLKKVFQIYDKRNYKKNDIIFTIKDSKKLSFEQREKIFREIYIQSSFCKNLLLSSLKIDTLGINKVIEIGIIRLVHKLMYHRNYRRIKIYIDGNYNFDYTLAFQKYFSNLEITLIQKNQYEIFVNNNKFFLEFQNVIKGDDMIFTVASSSIVSKVLRDKYMIRISRKFPDYHFEKNKGYGTKEHLKSILKKGMCILHRKSFHLNFQHYLFS